MFRIRSRIDNLDRRVRQSLWPFVRPDLFQKFNRQGLITLKRSFENILKLFRSQGYAAGFIRIEISLKVFPRPGDEIVVEVGIEECLQLCRRRRALFEFLHLMIYGILDYVLSERCLRMFHHSTP